MACNAWAQRISVSPRVDGSSALQIAASDMRPGHEITIGLPCRCLLEVESRILVSASETKLEPPLVAVTALARW